MCSTVGLRNGSGSCRSRIRSFVTYCLLLSLLTCCTGCALSSKVVPQRVPGNLLVPIVHPEVTESPVTVETLLAVIGQYGMKLEEANDRFAEIRFIQNTAMPQAGVQ